MDFLHEYTEVAKVYDKLDDEEKFMINLYNDGFRNQMPGDRSVTPLITTNLTYNKKYETINNHHQL